MHRISLPSVAVWQMFYVQITVKKLVFYVDMYKALVSGKTTLEYTAAERAGGASHYTLKKLMNFAISTIVGFSDFPLKLGLYAGAVSFLAAVIFAISALCGFREYKVILAAVNVLFAVLFLLVGIMGEYFSVAFAELKNRPIYIVEKEINSGRCV